MTQFTLLNPIARLSCDHHGLAQHGSGLKTNDFAIGGELRERKGHVWFLAMGWSGRLTNQ